MNVALDDREARYSPALLASHLDPEYQPVSHLIAIGAAVREAVRGEGPPNVLVQLPPGHGKSTTCSKWTPVWYLDRFPNRNVIAAAHTMTQARIWGRKAKDAAERFKDRLTFRVRPDVSSAHDWLTTDDGGMFCTGVDGPIVGRRGNLIAVDDPVKDAAAAGSAIQRESLWVWWQDTLWHRREPGCVMLLVMHRWHEDDVVGRIMHAHKDEWRVLRFPAVAEENDPMGRGVGEALWPARFPLPMLEDFRKGTSKYGWLALFQQRPTAAEGSMFKREHLGAYRDEGTAWVLSNGKRIPKDGVWIGQIADCAMEDDTDADYTAVLTFAAGPRGEILVLEVSRGKLDVPDQWRFILAARNRWREHRGYRWLGAEDSAGGKVLIQIARRTSEPIREIEHGSTDKVTRASLASTLCENGNLFLPESNPEWLGPFVAELLAFPKAPNDDQVDCLAYAAQEVRKAATASGLKATGDEVPLIQPFELPQSARRGFAQPFELPGGGSYRGD